MNSMVFHKGVYTARSQGYKYRTLATNTEGTAFDEVTQTSKIGDKKRRDDLEDSIFDKRVEDLKQTIHNKVDQQLAATKRCRQQLVEKMTKVDEKIDQMLAFQETVKGLRKDLTNAENCLQDLLLRVDKLDIFSESSDSTLLYRPGSGNFKDARCVLQQRGGYPQIVYGDYFTHNLM